MVGVSVAGVFFFSERTIPIPFVCVRVSSGLCSSSFDMIPCFCVPLVLTSSQSEVYVARPCCFFVDLPFFAEGGVFVVVSTFECICVYRPAIRKVCQLSRSLTLAFILFAEHACFLSDVIVLAMYRHNTSDYLQSAVTCQLRSLLGFSAAVVKYNSFHAGKISYFCGTNSCACVCVSLMY